MARTFSRAFPRNLIDSLSTLAIKRGVGPSCRYLVTVAGRNTGVPHTTPVSLVVDGANRYLVGPYGEVGWVRNARAAGVLTLSRAGRSEECTAEALDAANAAPILKLYLKLEPVTRPYFDVGADASQDALVREAATHPVFRLKPRTS